MDNQNLSSNIIFETLEYKDMEGLLKPTIHIDEFTSKMGEDDDIIVVSFFIRDNKAAKDLMNWFEWLECICLGHSKNFYHQGQCLCILSLDVYPIIHG
jgi:hypothetical protein